MEGQGTCTFQDGRVYKGQWRVSQMTGEGEMRWSDGKTYQGQYVDGHKEGFGKFWWPNGQMYEGEWKEGKQHGVGVFVEAGNDGNGDKAPRCRRGRWSAGKRVEWLDENH